MSCFGNGSAVKLFYVREYGTMTADTISAAASGSTFADAGSGFISAGKFAVGHIITVSGFATAANNGKFKIATLSAGSMTVTDIYGNAVTLVNESAGPSVTIFQEGGIPANPQFKPIRFVSEGLSPNINQIESNEINQARQRAPSRGGTYSVAGEIAAEVSFASFDDLIEAAMQSTWLPRGSLTAITISAAASDDSFNDSGNGFVAAGFVAGDIITTSGFATSANNGTWLVTSVAAGKIIVTNTDGTAASAITNETAGETVTVTSSADELVVGSTERSFAILERHTDISADYVYRGCRVATMNIAAPLGDKATITFGMLGTKAEAYSVPGGATFASATTSDMMVTTNGSFTEDGDAITYATEWNMTLDNGMEAAFSLFQREAYCVTNGIASVSGTMSAYLKDGTLWAKVLNETETNHVVVLEEGADSYTIELPKVRYTQGQKQVSGPGAVIPQYTYSAGYDGTTTLRITRS
nr:phage tail tube protein [Pseudomonas sp. P818]